MEMASDGELTMPESDRIGGIAPLEFRRTSDNSKAGRNAVETKSRHWLVHDLEVVSTND
jgi:hypothetical protein